MDHRDVKHVFHISKDHNDVWTLIVVGGKSLRLRSGQLPCKADTLADQIPYPIVPGRDTEEARAQHAAEPVPFVQVQERRTVLDSKSTT